jgi:CheY-like chemotaxis protein
MGTRMDATNKTLLIVEDDEDLEFSIADLVTDHGYRALGARNGIEALQTLRRSRPFVIILDLWMPEMDGFALIEAVRADANLSRIPMLVVTAALPKQDARLAGLTVFRKPLDSAALMSAIRACDHGEDRS